MRIYIYIYTGFAGYDLYIDIWIAVSLSVSPSISSYILLCLTACCSDVCPGSDFPRALEISNGSEDGEDTRSFLGRFRADCMWHVDHVAGWKHETHAQTWGMGIGCHAIVNLLPTQHVPWLFWLSVYFLGRPQWQALTILVSHHGKCCQPPGADCRRVRR